MLECQYSILRRVCLHTRQRKTQEPPLTADLFKLKRFLFHLIYNREILNIVIRPHRS